MKITYCPVCLGFDRTDILSLRHILVDPINQTDHSYNNEGCCVRNRFGLLKSMNFYTILDVFKIFRITCLVLGS